MAKVRDMLMKRAERLAEIDPGAIKRLSNIVNLRVVLQDKDEFDDGELKSVSSVLEVELHTNEGVKVASVPIESSGDIADEIDDLANAFMEAADYIKTCLKVGKE